MKFFSRLARWTPGGLRRLAAERAWLAAVLADLLDIGVPLPEALSRLRQRPLRACHLRDALASMDETVRRGGRLSHAAEIAETLPLRWAPLLRGGEDSGDLSTALRSLAALEAREPCVPYESLWWAGVCLLGVLGISSFVGSYVMPTFRSLHEGLNLPLPWTTDLWLHATAFTRQVPLLSVLTLGGLMAFLVLQNPAPALRFSVRAFDRLGGCEPGLRDQAIAASAIAAGLRVGLPVPEALRLAAGSVLLPRYRDALLTLADDPSTSLGDALARQPLFDRELIAVCRLSEDSESLAAGLALVGEELLRRADSRATRTRQTLGALLSLGVGLAVACVAVGAFDAIFSLIVKTMEAMIP